MANSTYWGLCRYCDPAKQKRLGFGPKTSLEEGIEIVAHFIK
jgi:hypothetical protein